MSPAPVLRETMLRGVHKEITLRAALLAITGAADDVLAFESDIVSEGFRTQVTLLRPAFSVADDLALALALSAALNDDALVTADPRLPDREPYHGLLVRPGGATYLVPLRDLESGALGIDDDPATWTAWAG